MPPFNFWQQAALNAVGPLLTVCLGSVLVAGVANWVGRRSQDRRSQRELRQSLAAEMAHIAYDLYFRCSHLDRGQRHGDLSGEDLKSAVASLDAVYVAQRVAMGALWSRLKLYFGIASEPSRTWHQVIDLLTVQYFHVAGLGPDRLAELHLKVAGADHAGLTAEELDNMTTVRATFEVALQESTGAVLIAEFDSALLESRRSL